MPSATIPFGEMGAELGRGMARSRLGDRTRCIAIACPIGIDTKEFVAAAASPTARLSLPPYEATAPTAAT